MDHVVVAVLIAVATANVKLSVGAVGAVEAVGGGGALSQEVEEGPWLVAVLPPASPSPGGGAVGGGAAACSPTVSQEEEVVCPGGRGPHNREWAFPRDRERARSPQPRLEVLELEAPARWLRDRERIGEGRMRQVKRQPHDLG